MCEIDQQKSVVRPMLEELHKFSEAYGTTLADKMVAEKSAKALTGRINFDRRYYEEKLIIEGWSTQDATYILLLSFAWARLSGPLIPIAPGRLGDEDTAYFRLHQFCTRYLVNSGRFTKKGLVREANLLSARWVSISPKRSENSAAVPHI